MSPAVPTKPAGVARLLHTSDWHLGVAVRNEPRSADHDAVIDEIVAIAEEAAPDLILHTGDLFDGPRPPMPEFARAIVALRRLAEVAPLVVLAGNHDSAPAMEVLALALGDDAAEEVEAGTYLPHSERRQRIRVHPRPTVPEKGAVATYPSAAGIPLRLAVLPFVHQNRVLTDFASLLETNATYNDSLRKIVGVLTTSCLEGFDPVGEVAVFASHVHISGATTSSERTIHVADAYATDPAHLDPRYGYLAFGHIHVPQPVAAGRGAYAGSILEVDFGEEGEAKRVVVVDLEPGRPTAVHSVPLTAGRRLRRVAAALSELADHADEVGSGIVEVTVRPEPSTAVGGTDEAPTPFDHTLVIVGDQTFDTLSQAVETVLPDATVVGVIDARHPARALDEVLAHAGDEPVAESIGGAFRTWLTDDGSALFRGPAGAQADPARVVELFDELLAAASAGEWAEPRELADLVAADSTTGAIDLDPG